MERVSKLEGAYEHMASKAELAELNGDYRVEFVRIEHRFQSIEETMRSMQADMRAMQNLLAQILERLERIENSNARIIGFQTSDRTLRDEGEDPF